MFKSRKRGYFLAIFVFLLSWYLFSTYTHLPIVPSFVVVFQKLGEIFFTTLLPHVLYSLFRIFTGLFLAICIGYMLGVLMGYVPLVEKIFSPLVYLSYPVPKIALLPLVMLFFGIGEASKIIMIVLIVVFQVVLAVRDGVKSIPKEYYDILRTLGGGFVSIFAHIIWQATLPKLFTSLRIGLATSMSVLFFTETFGTKYGMGFFIMDAFLRINYVEMYAGIVVFSLMGIVLFTIMDVVEHFACRWQNFDSE